MPGLGIGDSARDGCVECRQSGFALLNEANPLAQYLAS
jgi:hypothetical protein